MTILFASFIYLFIYKNYASPFVVEDTNLPWVADDFAIALVTSLCFLSSTCQVSYFFLDFTLPLKKEFETPKPTGMSKPLYLTRGHLGNDQAFCLKLIESIRVKQVYGSEEPQEKMNGRSCCIRQGKLHISPQQQSIHSFPHQLVSFQRFRNKTAEYLNTFSTEFTGSLFFHAFYLFLLCKPLPASPLRSPQSRRPVCYLYVQNAFRPKPSCLHFFTLKRKKRKGKKKGNQPSVGGAGIWTTIHSPPRVALCWHKAKQHATALFPPPPVNKQLLLNEWKDKHFFN